MKRSLVLILLSHSCLYRDNTLFIPLEMPFRLQRPDLPKHHQSHTCTTDTKLRMPKFSCFVHVDATAFYKLEMVDGKVALIFKIRSQNFIHLTYIFTNNGYRPVSP